MNDDAYWSIDAPGLDAEGAEILVNTARGLPSVVTSMSLNPERWLTRHFDRSSVEVLLSALRPATQGTGISPALAGELDQIVRDLEEWIEATTPNSEL